MTSTCLEPLGCRARAGLCRQCPVGRALACYISLSACPLTALPLTHCRLLLVHLFLLVAMLLLAGILLLKQVVCSCVSLPVPCLDLLVNVACWCLRCSCCCRCLQVDDQQPRSHACGAVIMCWALWKPAAAARDHSILEQTAVALPSCHVVGTAFVLLQLHTLLQGDQAAIQPEGDHGCDG
jgi:hypothetical protein